MIDPAIEIATQTLQLSRLNRNGGKYRSFRIFLGIGIIILAFVGIFVGLGK